MEANIEYGDSAGYGMLVNVYDGGVLAGTSYELGTRWVDSDVDLLADASQWVQGAGLRFVTAWARHSVDTRATPLQLRARVVWSAQVEIDEAQK